MLQEWAWVYFRTTSELVLVNVFYFIYRTSQIEIMVNKKASLRVSHLFKVSSTRPNKIF